MNSYIKIENYLTPYFSRDAIKRNLQRVTTEKGGGFYYILPEACTFNVYDQAEIVERTENENTIHVKVCVDSEDPFYSTINVSYIYENDKWLINSELQDWGTSPGF